MASSAPRVTPVATTARKPSLKIRLHRTRNLKLKLEGMLERCKCSKSELKETLRDRDAYIRRLEMMLDRHQRYIDQCTMRLPKVGKVPIAHCFDCGNPCPITQFQLRISPTSTAKNWTINGICPKCRKIRAERVDAKRREITAASKRPVDNGKHASEMAGLMVRGLG